MSKNLAENLYTLFENKRLLSVTAFLAKLEGEFAPDSVYQWRREGMPTKKIRGKIFVVIPDAFEWLERTSQENGNS